MAVAVQAAHAHPPVRLRSTDILSGGLRQMHPFKQAKTDLKRHYQRSTIRKILVPTKENRTTFRWP